MYGLQLIICPTRDPEFKYAETYNKIYKCWHSVWSKAYAEVKYHSDNQCLKSDSFTRQDFVAAIFHKNECVAFILFRYAHLDLISLKDDSFFSQWSEIHIRAVSKQGPRLLICGNLGVIPTFRQKTLGISLKELICGLIMEITVQSEVDATLATPRRDKNVHSAAYLWGATPIAKDISWGFGINVDLISFNRTHLLQRQAHPIQHVIDNLWFNKIVIEHSSCDLIRRFKLGIPFGLQSPDHTKSTG